ncbi:MAG: nitrate reductase subunit alpha [Planctomycetes bacterium]|nr:nitrate reductase subunit alpha [Planctomycetota bacterium]
MSNEKVTAATWIQDLVEPETRSWEEFYRNRWQYDKKVRSTHGVNCTGSCTWEIHVKDGIVTWELQGLDYPKLDPSLPPYEPRGCQRGISFSWYLYSPIRVKYPYIRGALLDNWKKYRKQHADPVDAWAALMADPESRARYQRARGKGGFRRSTWKTVNEIMAAANIYTAKKWGPDRVTGFSPIPAMSMLSYAAGSRFLQLFGGVNLSFYDWYCDLPPASPEIWGEQTDVNESADWFNAKMLAVMGSNLNMTRTPDCHFAAEARHNGTKMVVLAPDFNQVAKYADEWIALNAGQDGAFWMAVNHVILSEFHVKRTVPMFMDYQRRFTDCPFLVEVSEDGPGRLLRANTIERYKNVEKGEWKFLVWDDETGDVKMPKGTAGFRWQSEKGQWNLECKDGLDNSEYTPALSFLDNCSVVVQVAFDDYTRETQYKRGVPVKRIKTLQGEKTVATIYDVLMAQYGANRGLDGEYPRNYDDADAPFTPAWQEKWTGIDRKDVIKFAREWASTAEHTGGKCTVIIGAGINHWYHNNLIYRSAIHSMMFCGCIGKNGGGMAHYVGQEKLAPAAPWGAIAFAQDWIGAPRLQNAPSWHYVHSDQWRYEREFTEYAAGPKKHTDLNSGHTMDVQTKAVRMGWLPWFPQYDKNSIELVKEAEAAGCKTDDEIVKWVVQQLKDKKIRYTVEDPDAQEAWPRVWYIWRGNALQASAKGQEFFFRHYLGTTDNAIAPEVAKGHVKETVFREAVTGKMDLVVDINFRMDTSALYSDIVLPTATWYEKADLNSTDMHSFIHPLSEAVPPCWESKSDWDIFKGICKHTGEMAKKHLPGEVREIWSAPLLHDTPAEVSQPEVKDWALGECDPIPGKTMPNMRVITHNFEQLYDRYCSFGPKVRAGGLHAHGVDYQIADFYDEWIEHKPVHEFEGKKYPSLESAVDACEAVLYFSSECNGELAYRAFEDQEKKTGLVMTDLGADSRSVRFGYKDLQSQPRRLLTSPVWSAITNGGRAYSPFTMNVEKMLPWRTLTGRQHYYLDHEGYIDNGEQVPTYKPSPLPKNYGDLSVSKADGKTKMLNYLTPHGKWHIHSTYGDTLRMMTLSRGCEPFWMNDHDAKELDIIDNDFVEVHNDNGVVVVRCVVSARIPRGVCIIYHSPERTLGVPKSPLRGYTRAGAHNSLTRVRLKPVLMMGGYGQFTFYFNYWGPTGVNRDTHILVRKLEKLVY